MAMQFKQAVKKEAKARVCFVGPAGAGKSLTSLVLAKSLCGPNGRIAAVDTEKGSLSKYADIFDFDVIELDSFSPQNFKLAHQAAVDAGCYDVFLCDSLSHFWIGKDGALEFVDEKTKAARSRGGDGMAGWKDFRPHEREMIDIMTGSPLHVIVTMRSKTEYQEITDSQGKKKRVKIGLQPVQREGMEYEFDLIGYMDPDDHIFVVDKTRVVYADMSSPYAGKAFTKPTAKTFGAYREWLKGQKADAARPAAVSAPKIAQAQSAPPAQAPVQSAPPVNAPVETQQAAPPPPAPAPFQPSDDDIPQQMGGTWQDPDNRGSADRHMDAMRERNQQANPPAIEKPWRTFKEMIQVFQQEHEAVGDETYYAVLGKFQVKHANEFKSGDAALRCWMELRRLVETARAA